MIWALLLLGCNPFENNPPNLVSVNGYPLGLFKEFVYDDEIAFAEAFYAAPGGTWTITLEVDDPEGQHVRVWWPNSPAGWDFDPDETTGVWNVPAEPEPMAWIAVILEDTPREDPELEAYIVPVWNELAFDTGMEF